MISIPIWVFVLLIVFSSPAVLLATFLVVSGIIEGLTRLFKRKG